MVDHEVTLMDGLPLAVPPGEAKRGAWLAGTLAALTTATFTIAVLTPPLSGPWCKGGCFPYPYADIASRFPRDYYWMVPAMLVSVAFVAMLISVHRCTAARMKFFSLLGLVLGSTGAMMLATDYWVQLAVIQPSLLKGEQEGIALLSQFNPHGLFIALEELGFLLMSAGLACGTEPRHGDQRALKIRPSPSCCRYFAPGAVA